VKRLLVALMLVATVAWTQELEPRVDRLECLQSGGDWTTACECPVGQAFVAGEGCIDSAPEPPPSGNLEDGMWVSIPGSEMLSIFDPGIDDRWDDQGASRSFEAIQKNWGGGVCLGDELAVWGGGHGDGANNGVFAINVHTGQWRRMSMPSWPTRALPSNGPTNPDGTPVARHTYDTLTTDGQYLYAIGGSVWSSGTAGDSPTSWRFEVPAPGVVAPPSAWSPLASDPSRPGISGSVFYLDGKLYKISYRGVDIYDFATGAWSGGAGGSNHETGIEYSPLTDSFYAVGGARGLWTRTRAQLENGEDGHALSDFQVPALDGRPSYLMSEVRYPGVTWWEPTGEILFWLGGHVFVALDVSTETWRTVEIGGEDPGDQFNAGTFGRFSVCGGRLVVLNGFDKPVFYVGLNGEEPPPPPPDEPVCGDGVLQGTEQCDDGNNIDGDGCSATCEREIVLPPPPPPPPPVEGDLGANPYWADPPGDSIVEHVCGPVADWSVYDVTTDDEADAVRQLSRTTDRVTVRVHWRPEPYPPLSTSALRCVRVVGVLGPNGERPIVAGVSGTLSFKGIIEEGGQIVEHLDVSPGKARVMRPEMNVANGDCIGVPNKRRFFIVRDSDVTQCGHHAFITSPSAHHLYVEIGRSHFQMASSHLAYIDGAAMAWVYDSTFESPGWGHALRCIARRCIIERVSVSNVQLDGSVLPVGSNPMQPATRVFEGMHPLEVYVCGIHDLRDVHVIRRNVDQYVRWGASYRWREAMNTCDTGAIVNGQWERLKWGEPGFDEADWASLPELTLSIDGYQQTCYGEPACTGWDIKSTYPVMNDPEKAEWSSWLKANAFTVWEEMLAAIPDEHPEWREISELALPQFRDSILRGSLTNKVPLPVPATWRQRARITFKNVDVPGELLRPYDKNDTFCLGVPPINGACVEQDYGKSYDRAFTVVPVN